MSNGRHIRWKDAPQIILKIQNPRLLNRNSHLVVYTIPSFEDVLSAIILVPFSLIELLFTTPLAFLLHY